MNSLIRFFASMIFLYGISLTPVYLIALYNNEDSQLIGTFFGFFLISGFISFLFLEKRTIEIAPSKQFLMVLSIWIGYFICSSYLFFKTIPDLSFIDALFEACSGITATGATVLKNIDSLPKYVIYFRQQLQLLGGLGIILLAIAVLPIGKNNLKIAQIEITSPLKNRKVVPKLSILFKGIFIIYASSALICALLYNISGLSWFNAICYSFATISTGGFTPNDHSFLFLDSPQIKMIAIFFMIFAAINFNVHFLFIFQNKQKIYFKDHEVYNYLIYLFLSVVFIISILPLSKTMEHKQINTIFQVISFATTTGFTVVDYTDWPKYISLIVFLLGIIGGCTGSTAGGVKFLRIQLIYQHIRNELKKLVHPHGFYTIKLGDYQVHPKLIDPLWAYFALYIILLILFTIVLNSSGLDLRTSVSAVAASLSNIGPGLGKVATNYTELTDYAKIVLTLTMLIGRLEILPIILLFSLIYWRN